MNIWQKAQSVQLQVSEEVGSGFDIGFDPKIPAGMQAELRAFVRWVEANYSVPITLWVDFEYKHYLVRRDGMRVGYLFYWADFDSYPVFDNRDDIPQIWLPVRTEHFTTEEVLTSFIEAITDYYAWICNEIYEGYSADETVVEDILKQYLRSK